MLVVGLIIVGIIIIWIGQALVFAWKMTCIDSFQELKPYEENFITIQGFLEQSKHFATHPDDPQAQQFKGTANIRFCLELWFRIEMLLECYDIKMIRAIIQDYLSDKPLLDPDTQTTVGYALIYAMTIIESDRNKTLEENIMHIDKLCKTCVFILLLVIEKVMPENEKDEIFRSIKQSAFMKYHQLTLDNIKKEFKEKNMWPFTTNQGISDLYTQTYDEIMKNFLDTPWEKSLFFELKPVIYIVADIARMQTHNSREQVAQKIIANMHLTNKEVQIFNQRLDLYGKNVRGGKLRGEWLFCDTKKWEIHPVLICCVVLGDILIDPACAEDYEKPLKINDAFETLDLTTKMTTTAEILLKFFNAISKF